MFKNATRIIIAFVVIAIHSKSINAETNAITYTFDSPTACDNRCYDDLSRNKLFDGIYGLGDAQFRAEEGWVGWNKRTNPIINIDFSLETAKAIESVSISAITNTINLSPTLTIYGWSDTGAWINLGQAAKKDGSSHLYELSNISFTGQKARISASSSDRWVLIDEVAINVSSVPEPSALYLTLAGLFLLFSIRVIQKRA